MGEHRVIPQEAVDMLQSDPSMANTFDGVWGEGASKRVLGGTSGDQADLSQSQIEKDQTLAGKVWDSTVGAVVYGAQEAVNETFNSVGDLTAYGNEKFTELTGIEDIYLGFYEGEDGGFEVGFRSREEVEAAGEEVFDPGNINLELKDQPTTLTGNLVGGVSQFVVGMYGFGKITKLKGIKGAFVNGALADALVFNPKDQNITAMVESFGVDTGTFGDLMATNPDDPNWQNRLRNAAEGAAIGGLVEMIGYAVRAKKLKNAGRLGESADATASAVRASREVEKEIAGEVENLKLNAMESVNTGNALDDIKLADMSANTGPRSVKPDASSDPTVTPRNDPDQGQLDLGISKEPESVTYWDSKNAIRLTPNELEKIRMYSALAKDVDPAKLAKGLAITRPGSIKKWEDQLANIAATRDAISEVWKRTPGNSVERWSATKAKAGTAIRELAQLTGENPEEVIKRFNAGFAKKEDLAAEIVARSSYVKAIMRETDEMSEAIAKGEFDKRRWPGYNDLEHLKLDYQYKMSLAAATARENNAARASVGRALNAMKIDKSGDATLKRMMSDPAFQGNIEAMAKSHAVARTTGEPVLSSVDKALSSAGDFLHRVNTYRINALLSGPGTQEVNFVSNLLNTVAIPTQQLIGGAISRDARQMRHAVRTFRGMVASIPDGIEAALRAWDMEDAVLDPWNQKLEFDAVGSQNPITGIKGADVTMRLPSRLLLTMDEFFKQSAYRGRVLADADEMAMKAGLKGAEKAKFMKGYFADSFGVNGEAIRGDAKLQSQRMTFTEALEPGSFGASIQSLAAKYPLARFVAPFVRTPVNILSTAYQHVPVLGQLSRRYRDDIAAGGTRRAQARGKQAIGTMLVMYSMTEVSQGNITGSGPSDPRLRSVWLKNNRPYSVRIEQEDGSVRWVSYARFEPMSQLLAITADVAEITQNKYGENEARGMGGVVGAILMATAENSVNKTFTQGIHEFMKILSDNDPGARERALNSMIASFVPNVANQTNGDMAYREARTLLDNLWVRGPDYEAIDPKRDVLGEVVYRPLPKYDPLSLMVKDAVEVDPVMEELARIGQQAQTMMGQPSKMISAPQEPGGRLDLSKVPYEEGQSLYDAWLERTGTIKLGGKTLREAIKHQMGLRSYKRLLDGAEGMTEGTKVGVIGDLISSYRKAARNDIPEMVEIRREAKMGKRDLLIEHRGNINDSLFPKSTEDIERSLFEFE